MLDNLTKTYIEIPHKLTRVLCICKAVNLFSTFFFIFVFYGKNVFDSNKIYANKICLVVFGWMSFQSQSEVKADLCSAADHPPGSHVEPSSAVTACLHTDLTDGRKPTIPGCILRH